jgi:hypothetical protein
MNHHLMYPKQRDFKKDLDDVLSFCKEYGFYFHTLGLTPADPVNEANKYANYRIMRSCSDGDQHTYSLLEAFVDADDCDCYKEIFSIQLDYYDTQTVLLNELEIGCGGCDSALIQRGDCSTNKSVQQVRPTSPSSKTIL